ncbi:uncharacterized protein [Solanum lycopersicum]|uniref:uncharacterized protein isoform X1 n=1 Tax=Solanum lycopersicum TaxID=4081 RepID=UPI003749C698
MESGMDFQPFWQLQPISNFAHSFHHFKWTVILRNQTPMSGLTYNLFPDLWGSLIVHIASLSFTSVILLHCMRIFVESSDFIQWGNYSYKKEMLKQRSVSDMFIVEKTLIISATQRFIYFFTVVL